MDKKGSTKKFGIKPGSILYFLAICAMCGIIVYNIYYRTIGADGQIVKVFGKTPTIVMSGSMLPTIEIGAIALVEDCGAEDVEEGQIIVYRDVNNKKNIIHRVVDKFEYGGIIYLTTKGDNNESIDRNYTTNDNIIGKVDYIFNWAAPIMLSMIYPDGSGINQVKLFFTLTAVVLVCTAVLHIIVLLLHKIASLKVSQKKKTNINKFN